MRRLAGGRMHAILMLATTLQASSTGEAEEPVWRSTTGDSWSAVAVYANDSILVTSGGQTLARSVGDIALHADGRWFTSEDGTLTRVGRGRQVSGMHARLGAWQGWETTWSCLGAGEKTTMVTTVKAFAEVKDTFVFEQHFPEGVQNTSLGLKLDQALSQWPSFAAESLTWKAQGWSGTMSCGTTIADSVPELGAQFLSLDGGPVLTFSEPDAFVENCSGAVFSTFDNFKSGIWANSGEFAIHSAGPGASIEAAAAAAAAAAAPPAAPQCTVHTGVNYEHHDIFGDSNLTKYNTTTDLSGAECCDWCSGFSNCSAWTICNVCPAPYTNICFLKSSAAGSVRQRGAISGMRKGAPFPPSVRSMFVAGVHGGITSLPVNHSTSFVLVAPERKCRVETMKRWGQVMRQAYGTNHEPFHVRGPATTMLGYWITGRFTTGITGTCLRSWRDTRPVASSPPTL